MPGVKGKSGGNLTMTNISWETANQLMAEIIEFLEKQNVTIPPSFDFNGLVHLLHDKNNKQWSDHRQEWMDKKW